MQASQAGIKQRRIDPAKPAGVGGIPGTQVLLAAGLVLHVSGIRGADKLPPDPS